MSQYLTIDRDRGSDGFGSQLLSILSGIAVCHVGDSVYVHSPIKDLKLVGHNHYVGAELIRANDMIDSVVKTLGYNNIKNQTPVLSLSFCYNEIINMGVDNYYTQEFQSTLSNAYPLQSPSYYKENTHNIAIHIRRGSDISKEDMKFRYIENEKYTVMVGKLLKKYPQSIIHIFC